MRTTGFALLIGGIVVALAGASLGLAAWLGQNEAQARWIGQSEAQAHGEWKAASPSPTQEAVPVLTRISFPEQREGFIVRDGASDANLLLGPARVEWSAIPGGAGNSIIAAHRDTHFRLLRYVRKGQLITVERAGEVFHYRIIDLEIVRDTDVKYYQPTSTPMMTLVTCYPFDFFGPAPKRFIVRAELL